MASILLNAGLGLLALWATWLIMGDTRLGRWLDWAEEEHVKALERRRKGK